MPDLDDAVPFTTDDFLGDDDDLNHESTEEHVRDLEMNVILPEMVDVPPPTPSAPEAGQKELDKRMDFSNVAQRELMEERAAADSGRKESGDAFPSVLYKTQNGYRAEVWKGSDNLKIYGNKYIINAEGRGVNIYCNSSDNLKIYGNKYDINTEGRRVNIYCNIIK